MCEADVDVVLCVHPRKSRHGVVGLANVVLEGLQRIRFCVLLRRERVLLRLVHPDSRRVLRINERDVMGSIAC